MSVILFYILLIEISLSELDPFTKQDMQDEIYNRYPDYCG